MILPEEPENRIIPFVPETVSREATRAPLHEAHEVIVYRRQAVSIVAEWLRKDPDDLHAYEKQGKCYLDYPNPEAFGERLTVIDHSWWMVLRKVMATLIAAGILPPPTGGEAQA